MTNSLNKILRRLNWWKSDVLFAIFETGLKGIRDMLVGLFAVIYISHSIALLLTWPKI